MNVPCTKFIILAFCFFGSKIRATNSNITCCYKKVVNSPANFKGTYLLKKEVSSEEKNSNCVDGCIYIREDRQGEEYCFRKELSEPASISDECEAQLQDTSERKEMKNHRSNVSRLSEEYKTNSATYSRNQNSRFCSGKTLELDLFGKSAKLGSLYSSYDDTFFSELSLWSSNDIKNGRETYVQTHSQLGIYTNMQTLTL